MSASREEVGISGFDLLGAPFRLHFIGYRQRHTYGHFSCES